MVDSSFAIKRVILLRQHSSTSNPVDRYGRAVSRDRFLPVDDNWSSLRSVK